MKFRWKEYNMVPSNLGSSRMTVYDDVAQVFQETLKVKVGKIALDSRRGDLPEWDSLGHILLVEALGNKFALKISADDALNMESVADIVRIIESRTQSK
ncbi:MAG: acyl carrier protein [Candidatus Obscuribacterales bacterium]|nr:acyl carrier protein [Candidatus Obscuribacterales bacterium]